MAEVTTEALNNSISSIDSREIYNLTDLLDLFNHSYLACEVDLDENVKRLMLFILYLLIFVAGLVENLLVIWVNWQSWKSKSPINIYILCMAIADFGMVLSLPFWMLEVMLDYTWLWGSFFCSFTYYFYFANMYSSIFFLTALSVDRYFSIASSSHFWHRNQQKIRKGLCACIWFLAAVLPLPEVVHMRLILSSKPICIFLAPFETYDEWALAMSLLVTIAGFLIPFPIIAIFNILTARFLSSSNKPENRKQCRLIYAYIIVFFISWLPYHLILTLVTLQGTHLFFNCFTVHVVLFFYDIIDCFSLFHCVANPILYNFLSKNFKGKFMAAVVRYIPKDQRDKKEGEFSTSSTQHSIVITKPNGQPN
uniref:G-protein coupled receptor 182 n=1 Tax=Geotrypetes seraphini TaxID=260995 RepID=A0A6P8R7Y4_GEOSA|nr:G-protein coupled receptor 182 [Geotrypetes seraphini]XP_033794850.1 G-protein coupled receptor 182 [Geotrypetes seraphini]XP_033794851.1 G-protein coupled receptor 182 [Geotrypetes seraphini]